jgi:K+-sensing histidine kinase KdpD
MEKMKEFLKQHLLPFLFRQLAVLVCIAGTILILKTFESYLAIQLITLIFLLPVLVSTVYWGLTAGVLASILAFLGFNFYFIPHYFPTYTYCLPSREQDPGRNN